MSIWCKYFCTFFVRDFIGKGFSLAMLEVGMGLVGILCRRDLVDLVNGSRSVFMEGGGCKKDGFLSQCVRKSPYRKSLKTLKFQRFKYPLVKVI